LENIFLGYVYGVRKREKILNCVEDAKWCNIVEQLAKKHTGIYI
jgi:hypothetical protein